jgi:hypothetical protein
MTGLGWCRKSAKRLIVLSLLLDAAWLIAALAVGLIHFVVLVVERRYELLPDLLITTAGTFGLLGFMTWVLWDARQGGKRPRQGRDATEGRPGKPAEALAPERGASRRAPDERPAGGSA